MYKNLYKKHIGNIGFFGNCRMSTYYFARIRDLLELQKYNHKPLYELDMIVKNTDYAESDYVSVENDGIMVESICMCDYDGYPLGYDTFRVLFVPELCEYEDMVEDFLYPLP